MFFKAKQAPEVSWVSSLVPTSIKKPVIIIIIITHVDGSGECLLFGKDGKAIRKSGNVVFRCLVIDFDWLVALSG